jgi:hypothetical protein
MAKQNQPYNRGDAYEKKLYDALKIKGVLAPGSNRAGAGGGPDLKFSHRTRVYNLEVKLDLKADYGQKMLKWSTASSWSWSKPDKVTDLYDVLGVLSHLNSKKLILNKYNKASSSLTIKDRNDDQKIFEDELPMNINALHTYYKSKGVFYIQIGSGFGFYYLADDPAKLVVPQFDAGFCLRLRAKTFHSSPASNYGFCAVLKVKPKPKPSNSPFNIEINSGYKFPPISP